MFAALQNSLRELLALPGETLSLKHLLRASAGGGPACEPSQGLDADTLESELRRLAAAEPRIVGSREAGFRYQPGPWRFCPEIFQAALETNWWGRRVHYLHSVTSTMDTVRELIEAGFPKGGLVVAEHQSGGRGRRGNEWQSAEARDILCSFLLPAPAFESDPGPGVVSMTVALAVAETLNEAWNVPAAVVWPNDIYVNGAKLAGVLVEGPVGDSWIVGLGLNVHSGPPDWPDDGGPETLARERTSLSHHGDEAWDRSLILARLGLGIERLWDHLTQYGPSVLKPIWNARSALIGQQVELNVAGAPVVGKVLGMDETAGLVLETEDGRHTLDLRQASALRVMDAPGNGG